MLLFALWFPLLLASVANQATAPANYWTDVPTASARRRLGAPRLRPTRYRVLKLDETAARRFLQRVPAQGDAPALLALPLPNGRMVAFRVQRTAVMHPALAARYPELQTFAGKDAQDPSADLRLELTPTGLRAQIIGYGSTFLVEPYRPDDTAHYLSFDKAALPSGSKQWAEPAPTP
ncbi:hypothetical protein [Hymenobacter sp. CRA2]|uniref:hypothetical protein n=1 Tax=Hymenobacter sp. CRA2 TaxID=1955620 RepID=UPI00099001B6|nr:hypothetical protein [Hymenobacter sp. CRA2]OON67362.1 hypothetical protein B0919_18005 [Hymenobacter sp. CRA2]